MSTKNEKPIWSSMDIKALTEGFINHVYDKYYKSYLYDSEYYEKINNRLFTLVTILGFLVTILLGLKEILKSKITEPIDTTLTVIAFILPSVSSVILIYMTQKGYKRKEEVREEARIQSKYLVNEAKVRFAKAKNDDDFEALYKWLNEEIKQLQLSQAESYFLVHNKYQKVTTDTGPTEKRN